ncbi:MAG: class I SAM-dependent methyltransferase, partial [Microbacterium sp.]
MVSYVLHHDPGGTMAATTMPATSTILRCPGCGSARLIHYPASRKTGRSVLGCRACGLRSWAERSTFVNPTYSVEVETEERDLGTEYSGYADSKRVDTVEVAWDSTLERLRQLSSAVDTPRLYDVGAGDGAFLKLAESHGFAVAGNEVHAGAARLAKKRYGYDLEVGDLSELELEPIHDALTMWCVMVHTEDVDMTLDNCNKLLKPGGTLFLQT